MPEITIRRILNIIQRSESWINWLSKFCDCHNFIHLEGNLFMGFPAIT